MGSNMRTEPANTGLVALGVQTRISTCATRISVRALPWHRNPARPISPNGGTGSRFPYNFFPPFFGGSLSTFDVVAVSKTILRSVLTTFPAFAPYVNAWNEHESEEMNRRLNLFRDAFAFEASRNEGKFARAAERVEEISERMQLFERAVEAARREPSQVKLEAIARFAANGMVADPSVTRDDKLALLETLDTLTETDLGTLGRFASGSTLRVKDILYPTWDDASLGRLVASLRKLDARGLISETNHKGGMDVTSSVGDPGHWTNVWSNKDFSTLR